VKDDRSDGPLCRPGFVNTTAFHEEEGVAGTGNHMGLPPPNQEHGAIFSKRRGAGWGMLLLAVLLLGGCTLPGRGNETSPNEVSNEPQFTIVTVTIALSPTPRISEEHYTVQEGDTLSGIAEMYGVSWDAIIQANNLQSQDAIYVGQELVIPAPVATPEASQVPIG
jgi:nucleoid-associated protein YgaU